MQFACILFDLDGTLLDTAPDLICSLNRALRNEGLQPVGDEQVRPYISYGAAAMVRQCLDNTADPALLGKILEFMLDDYENNIAEHSVFFPGMENLLAVLEKHGIKWGIVTNKLERFTNPLMDELKLTCRAACIISGDTTGNSKPHPEPMLEACRRAGVTADECLYIGDSAHDIEAGKRAGMKTLAAVYGYLKPEDDPSSWHADALISHPSEILSWLGL